MCRNRQTRLIQQEEKMNNNIPKVQNYYDSKQVANMIKRYQELRSAVEIVSVRHERIGGSATKTGKEEILCSLVDIDQAIARLSPRQRVIIWMLQEGYSYEDICSRLGICVATIKFHVRQGVLRLTAYLNAR